MQMGLGLIGQPDVIFKRKFRWTLEIFVPGCGVYIPPNFCKVAARPKINLDNVEVHFLNGITWIPGKAKWEPITITYHDVNAGSSTAILSWLATLYNFQNPVQLSMSERRGYDGTAQLVMYDGCGTPLERWQLSNCFPEAVDFGNLDYESNEICSIEMTLRYTNVYHQNLCSQDQVVGVCAGCA